VLIQLRVSVAALESSAAIFSSSHQAATSQPLINHYSEIQRS